MAYTSHEGAFDTLWDYLNSEKFKLKDAGQFIAMLIALSMFLYMALSKFTLSLSDLTKTGIAAVAIPLLMIILYYSFS